MKFSTQAPAGQWIKATTAYEAVMAKAVTAAMRDVGKDAVRGGRASIAAAGFSGRWQRSLRMKMQPPTGDVLNPAVYIHSTINYSDVFETGAVIKGQPYLWLPLPAVPPGKNRPHMTPAEYVRNVGPLVTMRRRGKTPMLGAVIRTSSKQQPWGAFASRANLRAGRFRGMRSRGTLQTIPLFVGVPSVTIEKKFDVKGACESAFKNLDNYYAQHMAEKPYDGEA